MTTREQLKEKMREKFKKKFDVFHIPPTVVYPGTSGIPVRAFTDKHILEFLDQAIDDSVDASFEAVEMAKKKRVLHNQTPEMQEGYERYKAGFNGAVDEFNRKKAAFNQEKE